MTDARGAQEQAEVLLSPVAPAKVASIYTQVLVEQPPATSAVDQEQAEVVLKPAQPLRICKAETLVVEVLVGTKPLPTLGWGVAHRATAPLGGH